MNNIAAHFIFMSIASSPLRGIHAIAYGYLCALLAIMPWLLGGNRAQFVIPASLLSLGVALLLAFSGVFGSREMVRRSRRGLAICWPLLFLLWWLAPGDFSLRHLIADAMSLYGYIVFLPSGDYYAEEMFFLISLGIVSVFYIAMVSLSRRRRVRWVIYILVISGILQVAYSVYYMGGGERF